MLFSVEQAFVGRDEKRAPLKTPAWEATYGEVLRKKNKTRSSIFNESWKGLCFLQPPSPKVKRRTPSESLEKGWKKLSRPEMHV